ncbi:hypothetical protein AFCDBAGC_4866 [Methylobacterium cerastii]|uniref:Uncharacterized protein n=1 Tax=Methylobacterium cerastii TaxID=932741 RepID=A0ABQ4QNX7_9HYPH|nr:hypothetical protein [Methylobacterium cerastii]GJD46981.1 hypothetical protein AFCDBAGC_4866 [Methylobacterium cerastii]
MTREQVFLSDLFVQAAVSFVATVAYALPKGSTTPVDQVAESSQNGDDVLNRINIYLGAAHDDAAAFDDRNNREMMAAFMRIPPPELR